MIRANITPIPANKDDKGNWRVYIHISFVKIQDDQSLSKIIFDDDSPNNDYVVVKNFLQNNPLGKLELHIKNKGNDIMVPFSLKKPEANCWDLIDRYRLTEKFGEVRAYHNDISLAATIKNVQEQSDEYQTEIDKLKAILSSAEKSSQVLKMNIETYTSAINDLSESIKKFTPEYNNIIAAGAKFTSPVQKLLTRQDALKAKIKKAQDRILEKAIFRDNGNKKLTGLLAKKKIADDAHTIFTSYKKDKLVAGNQEDAVLAINKFVGIDNKNPKNNPDYQFTSDVEHKYDLTLSDVLAYFSGYPAFMLELGLIVPVPVVPPASLSNDVSTLGVSGIKLPDGGPITVFYQSVHYELNEQSNFFFPAPSKKFAERYKDGHLNLRAVNSQGNAAFALLQNTLDEVNYKQKQDGDDDGQSDQTNGFFLIQNDSADSVITSVPDGDIYLEHLLAGYRVDVKRNNLPWETLNGRDYTFLFPNGKVTDKDEGYISANSATKGYELILCKPNVVKLSNGDPPIFGELNILAITESGEYVVQVDKGITLSLTVKVAGDPLAANPFNYNNDTATLVIPQINLDNPLVKLADLSDKLTTELSTKKAIFNLRYFLSDKQGRLYFSGIAQNGIANKDTGTHLPSSMVFHFAGNYLSAPSYTNRILSMYFNDVKENPRFGIESFMRKQNIRLNVTGPKNTIPLLRIGDEYEVRCRLALIGGIGVGLGNAGSAYSLAPAKFLRQDPVHAPQIIFPAMYSPKGSYHHLQELGETEHQIIIREGVNNQKVYNNSSRRFIAPPAIEWKLAEWLKMMDDDNGKPDKKIMLDTKQSKRPNYIDTGKRAGPGNKKVYRWEYGTGRYGKYLTDDAITKIPFIADSMASFFIIVPTAVNGLDRYNATSGKQVLTGLNFSNKTNLDQTVQAIAEARLDEINSKFRAAFVPDKIPRCNFWTMPGKRKSSDNAVVWTLNVYPAEGRFAPKKTTVAIPKGGSQINIYLQKGDDIEFTIRCFTTEAAHLADLYYIKNLDAALSQVKIDPATKIEGKATVFAEKKIRIIYALQKPWNIHGEDLRADEDLIKQSFQPSRDLKFPFDVVLNQGIYYTGKTMGPASLMAEWDEIFDDIPDDLIEKNKNSPIRIIRHHKKVFDYHLPGFFKYKTKGDKGEEISYDMTEKVPSPLIIKGPEKNSDRNIYADVEGNNLIFRHELGSAKYHAIRYSMVGESRFRSYFSQKTEGAFSSADTGILKNNGNPDYPLLATVAPDKPQISHIVPLFSTSAESKLFEGLRIYLKRPWFSSGFGEVLAIVLADDQAPNANDTEYLNWVSQAGKDITTKDPVFANLVIGDEINFPEKRQTEQPANPTYHLPLDHQNPIPVKTRLFTAHFDLNQKLWYGDIGFPDKNFSRYYCPFIRLVTARFQVFSVRGSELSAPVACDFMQIYPDRMLLVDGSADLITITAASCKKAADGKDQTRIVAWPVRRDIPQSAYGYLLDEDDLKGPGTPFKHLTPDKFTHNYDQDTKNPTNRIRLMIIREYELFGDPDAAVTPDDMRLIYTYIVNIP